MQQEKRQHRRVVLRFPLEYRSATDPHSPIRRAWSGNISPGGAYFETMLSLNSSPPGVDSLLRVEFVVPPGEGHFPFEGRVNGLLRIVRSEPLPETPASVGQHRYALAGQFCEPLQLSFNV